VLVRIEPATEASAELHAALARLLPQLNDRLPIPTMERLEAIMADPAVTLLVAVDDDRIVGTSTVIVYTTPFWIKARLDEVVVDASARGTGVGEALVNACLDVARRRGAQVAELQSGRGPARDVANRLYRRMGFEPRDSNLYRITL
jgi:GNAT superfamily N-acetyltransferase